MKLDVEANYLGMVQTARDHVMHAIKSRRDVAEATADSVAGLFAESEWNPLMPGNPVAGAVTSGAVSAACELGAGLNGVANGILRGAMISGERTHAPMLDLIKQTAHSTIRAVAGLDADVSGAMTGLLDAASAGATAKGISEESAASAVAAGAVLGAEQTSWDTKQMVREVMTARRPRMSSAVEAHV
jgi:hypothetical protein